MESTDLTPKQAAIVRDRLIPFVRHLHTLRHPMRQGGFSTGDALLLATDAAYDLTSAR